MEAVSRVALRQMQSAKSTSSQADTTTNTGWQAGTGRQCASLTSASLGLTSSPEPPARRFSRLPVDRGTGGTGSNEQFVAQAVLAPLTDTVSAPGEATVLDSADGNF